MSATAAAPTRVVLAGVAGSGKTTVGRLLAPLLGVPFVDADDCHDDANRSRMARGEALDEPARDRWFAAVAARVGALARGGGGFVLACSLLRQRHRDALAANVPDLREVHLQVDGATLRERLAQRPDHFFPASLLPSQLAAWEAVDRLERRRKRAAGGGRSGHPRLARVFACPAVRPPRASRADRRVLPSRGRLLFVLAPFPRMRSRELFLLSTGLALLALAGLAWFGHEAFASSEAPPAMGGSPVAENNELGPVANADGPEVASAPVPAEVAHTTAGATQERVDSAPRTSGVVKGDIQLAVSAIPRIRSIRVEIVEARNATLTNKKPPTRLIREVTMGRGTPTFEIDEVPFSDYPYVVSVWSPGLNGSRATITVDAQKPVVDHLLLGITPGTPLSVLVRDQDAAPFVGLDLVFLPIGEPAGRASMKGTTNNYGSLVFDDVLAGDYQVLVSQNNLPVIEPQTMSVGNGGALHGQSYQLTIERGVPVQVKVHDRNFYPYVGAKVVATATDRIRLTVRETTSDATGVAAFAHLQPGTWQITVTQDKCYLWDQQVTVKPYQDPIVLDAQMAPIK